VKPRENSFGTIDVHATSEVMFGITERRSLMWYSQAKGLVGVK
jgi:hypothetical protein